MREPARLHGLANGVRVLFDPAPGYQSVAISVVAGRGARHEDATRNGWSHLLEHMVFKGAGGRGAAELVEAIEGEGGQINAATGYERTSFQARALPEAFDLTLGVLADLVLHPRLDADDLAREKRVVAQEIAEAVDTPDDQVFEQAQSVAFADQALGRPILGTEISLASADPAALEAWRAQLYAPERLVVSVAGAVDEARVLRQAEALFSAAPGASVPAPEPAAFIGGAVAETRRLEQAHLVFLVPAPGLAAGQYWTHRVVAEALGGGMASRLFQEVRERLGLAYAIDAYAEAWADAGVLGIYAGCGAQDAGRVAEAVARELVGFARRLSPEALARAKTQLKSGLLMARESLASRAEQAATELLTLGAVQPPAAHIEAIDRVGPEDLDAFETTLRAPGACAVAILGPRKAAEAASRFQTALFG
ncbi:MAG: insulinase family protein [Alphaproteobacteria bacterium]|nr:insulinase family protein [Alphaproteobacteria bacterium]